MGITKRPAPAPRTPEAVESFINGAPDAKVVTAPRPQEDVLPPLPNQDEEEGSVQITLRIGKEQLARLTAAAKRQGIPRASYIKRAIALQLEADEK